MAVSSERVEALDALRFFAILGVLFDHYAAVEDFLPGLVSVRFFLFLSGFLITRTLLRNASEDWAENRQVLKSFYGRRALRIWPLYHASLFGMLALGWITLPQFLMHGTFATNIVQAMLNNWDLPWFLAHVWTLCVQEQFYLTWPLLFVLLRSKRSTFLVCMVVVALIFRVGMWLGGAAQSVAMFTLPFATFDALAFGALAATNHKRINRSIKHPALTIAGLFAVCLAVGQFGSGFLRGAILPTLWLIPLGILTLCVFENRLGKAADLLKWAPLVFLGRISLGMYLLHLPVWQSAFYWGSPWLLSLVSKPSLTTFLVLTSATLVAATASWLLFEKPIQRFRRYLPYRRRH